MLVTTPDERFVYPGVSWARARHRGKAAAGVVGAGKLGWGVSAVAAALHWPAPRPQASDCDKCHHTSIYLC